MSGSNENNITIIEGRDLEFFLLTLGIPKEIASEAYRLRIWPQPDGTIKVKVNERTWSWTIGKADA